MMTINDFLIKHNMDPQIVNPTVYAPKMVEHMLSGLNGNRIDMPMIPTYLSNEGQIPHGEKVIVIDAGGTNYRSALASFEKDGCHIEHVQVQAMPGVGTPVTWDTFISFVADSIMPIINESDLIGFCFSYSAMITPSMDAVVESIDKEVVVTGSEGKLLGASLISNLEARGITGKKCIILNDTVAALLGGSANLEKSKYSDIIGMICGTGFNTCASYKGMIINLESGMYNGIPQGDIDIELDKTSTQPGEKFLEKLTSGAYLGTICKLALLTAIKEGYISSINDSLEKIEKFDGSIVDELASGNDRYGLFNNDADINFAKNLSLAIFERSARCACTTILSLMLLNDTGKDYLHPMCVCAEGSLISKSKHFKGFLDSLISEYITTQNSRYADIVIGHDTTLPGSAAAALLNYNK